MLYFAYGSNLHQKQMKRRCKNSKYIGCYTLKNFKLSFRNYYLGGGVADIEKKQNSYVLGAIYKITKGDEKKSIILRKKIVELGGNVEEPGT